MALIAEMSRSLDEVRVDLVPVLFGHGIRSFDNLANPPVALEGPAVVEGTGVTTSSPASPGSGGYSRVSP